MALTLSFTACVQNCCKSLVITDTTGAGTLGDGSGDWNDTVAYDNVTEALITITYPSGTEEEIDVTDEFVSAITGSFAFDDITGTFPDGKYTVTYQITDDSGNVYTKSIITYNYCNSECCVYHMWSQMYSYLCNTCDYTDYLENTLSAQALLTGLISSINCTNFAAMDDVLDLIADLCSFNNCSECL